MEVIKETVWYMNLDWSMIWTCILAVVVHILFLEISSKVKSRKFVHYAFYALSSLLVLSFISEVAGWVLENYTSFSLDVQSGINHFLAAISGLGGGYIVTFIINRIKKEDKNAA